MGVLDGLRVVEIASSGGCMFSGMFLADLGADVIVIEPPAASDGRPRPESIQHRGKRSVMLDLETPSAIDVVLRLVERADVLIEGMRPGEMERLGLGPEVCLARKPSLVYGRLTGWGQDGPLAHEAGNETACAALSGALWIASQPGEQPQAPHTMLGEVGGGGLYLTFGVLAAALRARADGRGQVVDAAVVDGSANLLNMMLGVVPAREGKFEAIRANGYGKHWVRSYRCADGEWIRVEPDEPQFYSEMIRRLGLDKDQRFVHGQQNRSHWPELAAQLDALFATKTRAQWCELLEGSDACFSPVLSPQEAAVHPHNVARGVYQTVDGILQAAPAPRFSDTPSAAVNRAPPLGVHTREVLRELGLDAT
jgi:alpha-methylacyl-CoA racemase